MSRRSTKRTRRRVQGRSPEATAVDLTTPAYRDAAAGPGPGEPRTARNTRQILPVGTVDEVHQLLPSNPEPLDLPLGAPERTVIRYSDRDVERSRVFVRATQVAPFLDDRRNSRKQKSGAPVRFTSQAILVALHLAAATGRPLLMPTLAEILCEGISQPMQNVLGVQVRRPKPTQASKQRRWREANRSAAARAFHRLLDTIDPSVLPKGVARPWEEVEGLKKNLIIEEQCERAAALDWVCNRLLETSYLQLPEPVRALHRRLGVHLCIDGTPVPAFGCSRGVNDTEASTDPDAAVWTHHNDHADPQQSDPSARKSSDHKFARELHLLATSVVATGDRQYLPNLAMAMTTNLPGVDPAGAARTLFASMKNRGHAPGYLAGDILYTQQREEAFQIPARQEGYDLVLGYGVDHIGNQGAHATGMQLVEGTYFAPCIPQDLVDLTRALRAKEITLKEYQEKIRQRVQYKMRTKQKPGKNGLERLTCPAAGPNPTAMCALKPASERPRPIRQADGALVDVRPRIDHTVVLTDGEAPTVCQQETVSVTIFDGAKYRQPLLYGFPEHTDIYNALRQGQEGLHGSVKDDAAEALGNPGRRRVRGWAALNLFTAILIVNVNTRRIIRFLELAEPDRNGDLYVKRKIRTGTHATTGNPPGAPPLIDDPPAAA